MIPLENRKLLIKNLKEGWDIRNACDRAHVSRSSLYAYYKEEPSFKEEVHKTIETFNKRKQKKDMLSARHALMKAKRNLKNKK
jgi:hypothetical protein